VTEAEWRDCTDPKKMIETVGLQCGARKLRLFACACCRRLGPLLGPERLLQTLTVAERFADGLATEQELALARVGAQLTTKWGERAVDFACSPSHDLIWNISPHLLNCIRDVHQSKPDRESERRGQVEFCRDIFGNHYRRVKASPSWSQWNEGLVVGMAEQIYEERTFEDLPMLADALEEAGCEHRDLLGHLRGGGVHVAGCWALDVVLGKT
jgi:hypothetical protein